MQPQDRQCFKIMDKNMSKVAPYSWCVNRRSLQHHFLKAKRPSKAVGVTMDTFWIQISLNCCSSHGTRLFEELPSALEEKTCSTNLYYRHKCLSGSEKDILFNATFDTSHCVFFLHTFLMTIQEIKQYFASRRVFSELV